jgi:hypothetical protein
MAVRLEVVMFASRIAALGITVWSLSAGCGQPESEDGLVMDRTEHDLGEVIPCEDRTVSVVIANMGGRHTGPLAVSLFATAAGGSAASNVLPDFRIAHDGCRRVALAPGGSCQVVVRAERQGSGTKSARLEVNGEPGGTAATTLTASIPEAPPAIALDRRDHSFGSIAVGATGPPVEFRVTNISGKPWRVLDASFGRIDPDFMLDTSECPEQGPAAGQACPLKVSFSPRSPGPKRVHVNVLAVMECRVVFDGLSLTGLAEP